MLELILMFILGYLIGSDVNSKSSVSTGTRNDSPPPSQKPKPTSPMK